MKVLVLGSGQLARMMCLAAEPLNIRTLAYDVNQDLVVHPITQLPVDMSYADAISAVDVITAEFEHIPAPILSLAEQSGKLKPGANAIQAGGDRRIEKALLGQAKVNNAKHHLVSDEASFNQAITELGLPIVFKTAKEGYDGKGQWRLKEAAQAQAVWQQMASVLASSDKSQAIVAEQFVPFQREVSMIGARNAQGEIKTYPLTENHHENGVLSVSLALGENDVLQQQADQMFTAIAQALDYVGVLAVEFFDLNGELLVNEIAPRVHNSGHWTQQGCYSSQFENHIRAVCGLPLGDTQLIQPSLMVNLLGEAEVDNQVFALPSVGVHWYNKENKPGRKMGHINVSAADKATLTSKLSQLKNLLPISTHQGIEAVLVKLTA
ncbi:5-(carboxyamino)imidazole ribonucleotide synthase [Motilimonas cestriensis]|uniref:N5-carboxyaminoimidazole ribonucleotide synthase n=1 Tax=Motilimonas cestriensis TaxID=2742685 RepID=A0ABS8WEF2_9GAMM|nr:5-(carboxyamino)imidazole ribonucleotide synthase [Motilimonas cestriensis]MCE2595730.1 5-(carboxyamino)imidazole ribonucleotide synthase [Motilimonas cestriensis]